MPEFLRNLSQNWKKNWKEEGLYRVTGRKAERVGNWYDPSYFFSLLVKLVPYSYRFVQHFCEFK
jgi:hypothetical protein